MGEQRLPESHSISSFSFSEMQLGRPEHHVGSAVHGCLAGAVGVLGLQVGASGGTLVFASSHRCGLVSVHLSICIFTLKPYPRSPGQVVCQGLLIVFLFFVDIPSHTLKWTVVLGIAKSPIPRPTPFPSLSAAPGSVLKFGRPRRQFLSKPLSNSNQKQHLLVGILESSGNLMLQGRPSCGIVQMPRVGITQRL